MKIAIVEDEAPAIAKLERYLKKANDNIEVVARLETVKEAVTWLSAHLSEVDLIFMDIQLPDGLSFDIFREVKINRPVIFATAYDEYAIDAFKVNSIDYLLKPVTFTDLKSALGKLDSIKKVFGGADSDTQEMLAGLADKRFKERFLVKLGDHIHSIKTSDIQVFFAEGRTAYLITTEGRKFIIDYKLETLEEMLDPKLFFRANRTFIININGIKDVVSYSNSRLNITMGTKLEKDIIVSRDRVLDFKDWFGGQ